MKKLVIAATAMSVLAFGSIANAEQALSAAQMDSVTAAGFVDAFADARARGVETRTATIAEGESITVDELQVPGQKGKIEVVRSRGTASSYAYAAPGSYVEADGMATGNTEGTLESDLFLTSYADADTTGEFIQGSKYSAYSYNSARGYASEIVLGRTATNNATAHSKVFLGN